MKKILWLLACSIIAACSLNAADDENFRVRIKKISDKYLEDESEENCFQVVTTPSNDENANLKKYLASVAQKEDPVRQKYAEVKRAFVLSKIKLYGKEVMQKYIEQKQTEFDTGWPRANSRGVCIEPMRHFYITVKRTFVENATDPLAKLVFDAIKLHEQDTNIPGFYMRYAWSPNIDGTLSLTCFVDAKKKEFEAAYDVKQQ